MASKVYYWNLRASGKQPYALKIKKLLKSVKLNEHVRTRDHVGLKLHFGEKGGTGHLRPIWIRPFVDFVIKAGAHPFLTDTNTLYVGHRGESVAHLLLSKVHGYDPCVTGAPVIIADGIKGQYEELVPIDGKHFDHAHIGGEIAACDHLIFLSHFKGHKLAGIGGAIKNIGMGCASKQGKMIQHSSTGPKLNMDKCTGCGRCVQVCAAGAMSLDSDTGLISADNDKCTGCGACFLVCTSGCLQLDWKTDVAAFLEKMAEYAKAVLSTKTGPSLCVNFLSDIVPDCDCVGFTDAPMCPDLGIVASYDPVACDQACLELVNAAPVLQPSKLPAETKPGDNKFLALRPDLPPELGLDYAEKIGLGSRDYALVHI